MKYFSESANGPVIGVIILVVIIILIGGVTVIARAKGALCFGGKSKNCINFYLKIY